LVSELPTTPEEEVSKGSTGGKGSGTGQGSTGNSSQVTFVNTVTLPGAKACISRSSLRITLREPKYDPLEEVVVKIGNKKVLDLSGVKAIKKGITLTHLPTGSYKISVLAITVLKQRLHGSQSYKSCSKGSGKIKLSHAGHHKHS
jgi:hypothetical protein